MNEIKDSPIDLSNTVTNLYDFCRTSREWNVKRYAEKNDFQALWSINDANPLKNNILIVWDGYPKDFSDGDSKISLADYLTPIDWALAYSSQYEKSQLQIVILDVYSHQMSGFDFQLKLLQKMEWVKFYSFNYNNSSDLKIYSPLELSESLADQLQEKTEESAPEQKKIINSIETNDLKEEWLENIRKSAKKNPSDHHNVNNILGPIFLLKEHSSIQKQAFRQCLEWLGLVSEQVESIVGEEGESIKQDDYNILAVDDKLDVGWAEVLERMFGGYRGIKQLHNPKDSETNFMNSLKSINKYQNRCLDTPFNDDENPWFLVLDLHLYSDKEEEKEFFSNLLEIAEDLVEQNKGLAWVGFDLEEIKKLEKWLDSSNKQSSDKNIEDIALSLLPRLCALRWPATPIFLFSITRRRNLITKLAPYRNIFLVYNKPDFLYGSADEQIDTFNYSWRKEWSSARRLIKVQEQLIKLSKRNVSNDDEHNPQNEVKHHHIVIALDENINVTGGPIDTIGAVLLFSKGDNEDSAKKNSYQFQEKLRQKGLNYYQHTPYYSDLEQPGDEYVLDENGAEVKVKKKINKLGDGVRNLIADLQENPGEHKSKLGFFKMKFKENINSEFEDSSYLSALSNFIEIILAEFLYSEGFNFDNTTISFWLPTKQVPISGIDAATQQATKFDVRLQNFKDSKGKYLIESVGGPGLAYSILQQALGERTTIIQQILRSIQLKTRKIPYTHSRASNWVCPNCRKQLLILVKLSEENEYKCSCNNISITNEDAFFADYSVMQHLVDKMLDISRKDETREKKALKKFNLGYYFNGEEEQCVQFLQSARLFDHGIENEDKSLKNGGFKHAYRHKFFEDGVGTYESSNPARIETSLVEKLQEHVKSLDGDTIIELAGLKILADELNP